MQNWLVAIRTNKGKEYFTIAAQTRNEASNTATRLMFLLLGNEPNKYVGLITIEEI